MSRFTIFSLILIAAGLLLLLFQSIQSLMGIEIVWREITLAGLMKPGHVEWFESISLSFLRDGALYVLKAPLFAVLVVTGGILLIFSGLFGRSS